MARTILKGRIKSTNGKKIGWTTEICNNFPAWNYRFHSKRQTINDKEPIQNDEINKEKHQKQTVKVERHGPVRVRNEPCTERQSKNSSSVRSRERRSGEFWTLQRRCPVAPHTVHCWIGEALITIFILHHFSTAHLGKKQKKATKMSDNKQNIKFFAPVLMNFVILLINTWILSNNSNDFFLALSLHYPVRKSQLSPRWSCL